MQKWSYISLFCTFLLLYSCNNPKQEVFEIIPSSSSGIDFQNQLVESDSFNILNYLYYYNGGGVAVGDLNNDGLPDIFFSANQSSDKLFINKGNLTFEDQTKKSGIDTSDAWSTGVTIVDVNGDGWNDIYVCRLGDYLIYDDHNVLYINNKNGTFTESSEAYGLAFKGFSTQAAFFDYDHDGDLDCYLLNHSVKNPEQFVPSEIRNSSDSLSGDRFLRNDRGRFVDITESVGIYHSTIGFGLGIAIGDLNQDGWDDIYIGNDFHEQDYIYLNQKGASFAEVSSDALGHSSNFTMGVAIADLNDDERPDVVTLDMQADDEAVYKSSGGWENLQIYNFKHSYGYHYQSPRNTIQINQSDSSNLHFSEIAALSNFSATDWSWSPLIADFNGDLIKDIYVTNGIFKRPNDMDFVDFMSESLNNRNSNSELFNKMPSGQVANYYYQSEGNSYHKISLPSEPSISTGATYADLDLDGDYDIIVNNINQEAFLLKNSTNPPNHISIHLTDANNKWNDRVIGGQLILYCKNAKKMVLHNHLNSGFQSSTNSFQNVTLPISDIDSIMVFWPDGKRYVFQDLEKLYTPQNHILSLDKTNARERLRKGKKMFESYRTIDTLGSHTENSYNDQNNESLIPYLLSTNTPKVIQGKEFWFQTTSKSSAIYILNKENVQDTLAFLCYAPADINDAVIADFDGDGLEDIYLAVGGNESQGNNLELSDILYFQQTDKTFQQKFDKLPIIGRNTGTVSAGDLDKDGDIDLFVGVQGKSGQYGSFDKSYFLFNSGAGKLIPQDTDIEELVFDSEIVDLDNNGFLDVVVAGHWMPITILDQEKLKWFNKKTIPNSTGLWFTIEIDDVDKDGNLDIMGGNFGINHRLASSYEKVSLISSDFDGNNQTDPIISYLIDGKEYPFANFGMMTKQLPFVKKKFRSHSAYAKASMDEIFNPELLAKATKKELNTFYSTCFLQKTNMWEALVLPEACQLSPIWAFEKLDDQTYLLGGNYYGVDPNWGRQDALFVTKIKYRDRVFNSDLVRPIIKGEIRDISKVGNKIIISRNHDTSILIREK